MKTSRTRQPSTVATPTRNSGWRQIVDDLAIHQRLRYGGDIQPHEKVRITTQPKVRYSLDGDELHTSLANLLIGSKDSRPYLIAIIGVSGSGKSYTAWKLLQALADSEIRPVYLPVNHAEPGQYYDSEANPCLYRIAQQLHAALFGPGAASTTPRPAYPDTHACVPDTLFEQDERTPHVFILDDVSLLTENFDDDRAVHSHDDYLVRRVIATHHSHHRGDVIILLLHSIHSIKHWWPEKRSLIIWLEGFDRLPEDADAMDELDVDRAAHPLFYSIEKAYPGNVSLNQKLHEFYRSFFAAVLPTPPDGAGHTSLDEGIKALNNLLKSPLEPSGEQANRNRAIRQPDIITEAAKMHWTLSPRQQTMLEAELGIRPADKAKPTAQYLYRHLFTYDQNAGIAFSSLAAYAYFLAMLIAPSGAEIISADRPLQQGLDRVAPAHRLIRDYLFAAYISILSDSLADKNGSGGLPLAREGNPAAYNDRFRGLLNDLSEITPKLADRHLRRALAQLKGYIGVLANNVPHSLSIREAIINEMNNSQFSAPKINLGNWDVRSPRQAPDQAEER